MTTEAEQHRPFADEGELQVSLNALRDQLASLDRRNTESMARIEAQTTKTNGRVTALEQEVTKFQLWKAEVRGIAQGAGGTGRLLVYMLTSGAAAGSILGILLNITGHLK